VAADFKLTPVESEFSNVIGYTSYIVVTFGICFFILVDSNSIKMNLHQAVSNLKLLKKKHNKPVLWDNGTIIDYKTKTLSQIRTLS